MLRALSAYGFEVKPQHLVQVGEGIHTTFRVDPPGQPRHLLRLYGEYDARTVASECEWLEALRRDTGLHLPVPVAHGDGWVVEAGSEDTSRAPRPVALFRWVDGEPLTDVRPGAEASAYRRLGELMARLHRHGAQFTPDAGFNRPRYDAQGLLGTDALLEGTAAEAAASRLTAAAIGHLDAAAAETRQALQAFGESSEVFGLIHGDLQLTNYLLHRGEAGAIDFADCGWGHHLYDMATALLPLWGRRGLPAARDALVAGYSRIRPIPSAHVELLDTFLVARGLYLLRWTFQRWDHPAVRTVGAQTIPHLEAQLLHHLGHQPSSAVPGGSSMSADAATDTGPDADRPDAGRRDAARRDAGRSVTSLLGRLKDRGIRLWVEDGRLLFKAAKGALTPELRDELKTRKADILAFLAPRSGHTGPPLVAGDRPDPIPLSYAQERLWILCRFSEASSVAYNINQSLRLEGSLDPDDLRGCFQAVVDRHEALRTTFPDHDGVPHQHIEPRREVPLPMVDLRGLPAHRRRAEADRVAALEAARPFDLAQGPLARFGLLRLGHDAHRLLLSFHHIVGDGWSNGVLLREVAALYTARVRGRRASLPPLPLQYADFALWQRRWLTGQTLEEHMDYWRQQLGGAPGLLELPTDRPRPPVPSYRGRRLPVTFPPDLTRGLEAMGRASDATLFMVLLAAFKGLVYRLTGRRDLVMGSPIANRNRREIEGLIGFFVNTLVLRNTVAPSTSFEDLLAAVRQTTLDAYAHQDLPFEMVVDDLNLERSASHAPLFQVLFILQNAPMPPLELPGLTLTAESVEKDTAKFDITLGLWETERGLEGALNYNSDLYDPTTMERMMRQLGRVLQQVADDPRTAVADLELLGPSERHQLLHEWNDTAVGLPDLCVHELFEAQVARTPDATALAFDDDSWTYRELADRARRLAHHLRGLGVGPDDRVAVLMPRSPHLVTALLAVLGAGGAYVPFDPSIPAERLYALLESASARVLIHRGDLPVLDAGRLAEAGVTAVDLAADAASIDAAPNTPLGGGSVPSSLAYVMYTSGSTGLPKGVCISHRAVVRLVHGLPFLEPLGEQTFFLLAPVAFDVSTLELWCGLLHGATLAVAPTAQPDFAELAELLERYGVTVLWLTAGLFHLMVSEQPEALAKVPHVLAGGDILSVPHVRQLLAQGSGHRVVNGYGPTECTTFIHCHPMAHEDEVETTVSIGRPIGNTQAHLVDPRLRPVGLGVPGELLAAGDGLARAYLGSPRLTAEKFTPNPFARVPGDRLYRTGDLARHLGDGRLEFLGRFDHQVKIRGFRIELGEIETALGRHPTVDEAVVLANPKADGADKGLTAYLVTPGDVDEPPTAEQLRRFLRQDLPEYMVPAVFVILEEFPLNSNGKVDRRALAETAGTSLASETAHVPPSTPTEHDLAELWAELLGVDPIGVHDNFFDRGGNSLLATRILSRLTGQYGVKLPLSTFFEGPTIAELAQHVDVLHRIAHGERAADTDDDDREEGDL